MGNKGKTTATDKVGRRAMKRFINGKTVLNQQTKSRSKYSTFQKTHRINFRLGFDLLQYNIVVRPFICKLHRIKHPLELDALLYLYPIQFFTTKDFAELPLRQYNITLKSCVDTGYLKNVVVGFHKDRSVYSLSDFGINIVQDYYQYLSGEKTINDGKYKNPFRAEDSIKIDAQREKVMVRLKEQTEKNPSKFRKSLYSKE